MTDRDPQDGWHIDDTVLRAYAQSALAPAAAWSVEAHLPGCAHCRSRIAPLADQARLERVRTALIDRTDQPRVGLAERALVLLGVREHTVRLLLATPALRRSWLLAICGVLAFMLAALHAAGDGIALFAFLVLAPVLPVAGVATAYGAGIDPTHELTLAAPISGFRLLLVRATAVLVVTIAIAGAASVALPAVDPVAAAWLLPALALSTISLALSPVLGPIGAAAAVGAGWVVLIYATAVPSSASALPFTAGGQVGSALCGVAAFLLFVLQRHRIDNGNTSLTRRDR